MAGRRQGKTASTATATAIAKSMKRERGQSLRRWDRNRNICSTTAFLVCIATLQSLRTIEYGESYVLAPPPLTIASTTRHGQNALHASLGRPHSVASVLGSTKHDSEPLAFSPEAEKASTAQKSKKQQSDFKDQYKILNHDLLTREEEYDLGCKIRKSVTVKNEIAALLNRKKVEEENHRQQAERRREEEAERRRNQRTQAGAMDSDDEFEVSSLFDDDLSMEEELEELLITKGLNTKTGSGFNTRSRLRNSIEDLYGDFDEDEEAMMNEMGMGIYGIDSYTDYESASDDLAIVNSYDSDYALESDYDGLPGNSEASASSQLGDTLNTIQMLTEREIKDELGVDGGRKELTKILIQGAVAKQQMIKSNVRLVTSIAKKWMSSSKGSGLSERSNDNKAKLTKTLGDWSTPAMDEVVQQGIVGLAIAAERFEPERQFKFSTYATYYITNEVRQVFQSATTQCLYVPPYFYNIKNKYQKIVKDHYRNTAADPEQALSLDRIAGMLDLKPDRLRFILKSTRPLVQLDAPIGGLMQSAGKAGAGDDSVGDPIINTIAGDEPSPEYLVEKSLLRLCIDNAMHENLEPIERDIVSLRHGLNDGTPRTIKEVIESLDGMLSIGDIRSLESRAYKKLRFKHSIHNRRLRDFAEDFMGISPELLETAY